MTENSVQKYPLNSLFCCWWWWCWFVSCFFTDSMIYMENFHYSMTTLKKLQNKRQKIKYIELRIKCYTCYRIYCFKKTKYLLSSSLLSSKLQQILKIFCIHSLPPSLNHILSIQNTCVLIFYKSKTFHLVYLRILHLTPQKTLNLGSNTWWMRSRKNINFQKEAIEIYPINDNFFPD